MSKEQKVDYQFGFVENSLNNITDKPSKEIGKTFENIIYLACRKINNNAEHKRLIDTYHHKELESHYMHNLQLVNENINNNDKKIKEFCKAAENQVKNIDEKNICTPDIRILSSALNVANDIDNSDEIKNLFAHLCASCVNKTKKDHVHPIFLDIIKRMTAIDAKIFRYIADMENISYNSLIIENEHLGRNNVKMSIAILVHYNIVVVRYTGFTKIITNILPFIKLFLRKQSVCLTLFGKEFKKVCM